MIRVLALGRLTLGTRNRKLVEQAVRFDHVVPDTALANHHALQLSLRAEVVTIVITEMVVRRDGQQLIPAFTRNSASTDLSFVCPDLRSSPPMKDFSCSASSMTPGTNVFWGAPLMKGSPSRMEATGSRETPRSAKSG